MDLEHINKTMLTATQESIESLAFAEVYASTDPTPMSSKDCLQVQMDITSPASGFFILQAPTAMLEEIAQTLFPATEDLSETQINDLASELLNTIGGNFLSKILPESTSFSLGLPQIMTLTTPDEQDQLSWNFNLDEISFSLYLTGEIVCNL